MKVNFSVFVLLFLMFSCTEQTTKVSLTSKIIYSTPDEYIIPGKPSIRGLDVFDSETVWISGSKGTFAVSSDKGKTWESGTINNDTLLDFRDIVALSKETALAISAGSPAKIYKTIDGGKNWKLKYENNDPDIFFNSFEFWDKQKGIACADPLNGKFFFIITNNGGESWEQIPTKNLPKPLNQEGGFAASGTCIAVSESGIAMFGTGGDQARLIITSDFGKTWKAVASPLKAKESFYGIYSIAWFNDKTFAITGGNFQKPEFAEKNFAITNDNGKTWNLTPQMPNGFRSCVKFLQKSSEIIICGINGVDISKDFGNSWIKTNLPGYSAVDISPNNDFIVFAGSDGNVASYVK